MRDLKVIFPCDGTPIYKVFVEEARWGAAFPGNVVPMCMIRGKCAGFRAKTVDISGHLPTLKSI